MALFIPAEPKEKRRKTSSYGKFYICKRTPARYTSKVRTVENWNSKGTTNIPILTAPQFIEEMKDLAS